MLLSGKGLDFLTKFNTKTSITHELFNYIYYNDIALCGSIKDI